MGTAEDFADQVRPAGPAGPSLGPLPRTPSPKTPLSGAPFPEPPRTPYPDRPAPRPRLRPPPAGRPRPGPSPPPPAAPRDRAPSPPPEVLPAGLVGRPGAPPDPGCGPRLPGRRSPIRAGLCSGPPARCARAPSPAWALLGDEGLRGCLLRRRPESWGA